MVMVVETTATQQPTTVGQVSDTNNTQNTINTASNVAASTQNEAPIIAAKNAVTALPLLSPKWLTTETDMPPKATVDCPIMPRISPVWRFGLVADAYAPLQQRNQFGVGAVVSRTLGKHWRTETGLHYQMLLGTLPNTQQSNQILYSFGKSATAYQLTPSQIHRLMLPVSLQYTHGAHLAEVGGAVHYLAGVRGTIANSTSSETQRGWVGPTGLRTWNAGVFGGYRYRITPGLVVGLRVHYLPKGIWAANYDFGSGYTTTFSDKLSGNLSIYYYFKTRK